jgi:hypothetical protein
LASEGADPRSRNGAQQAGIAVAPHVARVLRNQVQMTLVPYPGRQITVYSEKIAAQ